MTLDEFEELQSNLRRVIVRRHLQVKNRNVWLVESCSANGSTHVICRDHVVFASQGPIQLLGDRLVIVDDQNSGLHLRSLLNYSKELIAKPVPTSGFAVNCNKSRDY